MTGWTAASLFHSPLESGVRIVTILDAMFPAHLDLQSLGLLDYLLVHSADGGGPPSLHPATPMRTGEITVRRAFVEHGLQWMASAGLVQEYLSEDGFTYGASDAARPFLDGLTTRYAGELRERAIWLRAAFWTFSSEDLDRFVSQRVDRWTADFALVNRAEGLEL
jgi:hypothetical protein